MVEMTLQIPEKLAARIGASGVWFPTIIETGLLAFQSSSTVQASNELIRFLSSNPTPKDVLDFFLSEKYQDRLGYLLDLNGENEASESEIAELAEWTKLNHISILLKIQAANLLKEKA